MCRFFLGLVTLFLSSLCWASVSDVALSDHALRLAILKYNPKHLKPLTVEGAYHRTIVHFLQETLKRFPDLATLPFYPAENRYLQLSITLASDGSKKREKEMQTLVQVAGRFMKNCPYEVESTSNESHLGAKPQKNSMTVIKAVLGTRLSPSGTRCKHPLMARAQQLGLQELELRQFQEENQKEKKHLVTVNFNSTFSQDLEYVAKALLESGDDLNSEEKTVLTAMAPAPLRRQNDYYESMILYHPGTEESEDIEVEFIDRWERGGVIYTHHYFVRGISVVDSDRAFKIELVREWGPQRPK